MTMNHVQIPAQYIKGRPSERGSRKPFHGTLTKQGATLVVHVEHPDGVFVDATVGDIEARATGIVPGMPQAGNLVIAVNTYDEVMQIRIDCMEVPAFWLEITLPDVAEMCAV
jgi:hypothetical protein